MIVKPLALLALCAALFSFTHPAGGEGYEIFLNNRLLAQHFGATAGNPQTLTLDQTAFTGQLVVKYYHCGQPGKSRVIVIRNPHTNASKQWTFADSPANPMMTIALKDVSSLQDHTGTALELYYTSSLLPTARLLATIETTSSSVRTR